MAIYKWGNLGNGEMWQGENMQWWKIGNVGNVGMVQMWENVQYHIYGNCGKWKKGRDA